VLILAGAGSGKTRTLTHRLAHLVAVGVPPYRILAVTFTNKAAGEMKERIRRLIGDVPTAALWVGTFHSIGARILRRDGGRIGFDRSFSIYDADDALTLVRRVCRARGIDDKVLKPAVVRGEISAAKSSLWTPDDYVRERPGPHAATIADLFREYEARRAANNAADFDDLLALPVKLFREHPDVLAAYQARFDHLLIDEYQDTNHAQYVLVKLLAERHHNICAVGDDDQSIYGWRGADITNILNFEQDFPEATVIRLEQNYRSTKVILRAAGAVVRNNVHRKGKELWTENGEGELVVVAELDDDVREAEWVHERVQAEHRAGRAYREMVVLYRTNAQSRALEEAFVRARTPYVVVGGLRFYERKEIKDALAYLRVVDNPLDSESLRRIINVPRRGIGETTMARVAAIAAQTGRPLLDVMRGLDAAAAGGARAAKPISEFVAWLDGLIALKATLPADEMLHKAIYESGYVKSLEEEGSVEAETRAQNLDELLAGATRFAESNDDRSVSAFLQEVSLVTDIDTWDETADAATFMTLHSAKGLEFPIVFIAGLEETLFPLGGALDSEAELEEERRLFYVGLTRAKERVHLTHARRRRRYGDWMPMAPSRFLDEIPPDLIDEQAVGAPPGAFGRVEDWPSRSTESSRKPSTSRRTRTDESVWRIVRDDFSQEHPHREDVSQVPANVEEVSRQVIDEFLQVGRHVIHPTFGRGTIVAREGAGRDLKVVIRFDDGVRKKIIARVAHLEPAV